MRVSGRISFVTLLAVVAVVFVVVVFVFSKPGPGASGGQFMDALIKGDVDRLVDLSYTTEPKEQLKSAWEFATQQAGKHYNFAWKITSTTEQGDIGTVNLAVQRNLGPGSYDENFSLPMKKVDGKWLVDVGGISREMYPALPKPVT